MNNPKENAYDTDIFPLMAKIISVCKEHKINMAATFALDSGEDSEEPLFCTTVLTVDDADIIGKRRVIECKRVMNPMAHSFSMITTTAGTK